MTRDELLRELTVERYAVPMPRKADTSLGPTSQWETRERQQMAAYAWKAEERRLRRVA